MLPRILRSSFGTGKEVEQGLKAERRRSWHLILQLAWNLGRGVSRSSARFSNHRDVHWWWWAGRLFTILGTSATSLSTAIFKPLPLSLGTPSEKSKNALIKIAFQSLALVCESLTAPSPDHLGLCIGTLGQFGKQSDMNIALTAAASLLGSVSDARQSKWKHAEKEPEYSAMFLLLEVLGLCTDPRSEVRDGAIQTLFRTMRLYCIALHLEGHFLAVGFFVKGS